MNIKLWQIPTGAMIFIIIGLLLHPVLFPHWQSLDTVWLQSLNIIDHCNNLIQTIIDGREKPKADTVWIAGKPFYIDTTTHLGDIPWRKAEKDTAFAIITYHDNKPQKSFHAIHAWFEYQGLAGDYGITIPSDMIIMPTELSNNQEYKLLNISILGGYAEQGKWYGEIKGGLQYKLIGADGGWATDRKWFGKGGISIWF